MAPLPLLLLLLLLQLACLAPVATGTKGGHFEATVSPADCEAATGACEGAFRRAIEGCAKAVSQFTTSPESTSFSCRIVVAAADKEYRVACPQYSGPLAYIKTPAAIDLSPVLLSARRANTPVNLVLAGSDPSRRPTINVDYVGNGCPAIGASASSNTADDHDHDHDHDDHDHTITVAHLNIDAQRLPFSYGAVAVPAGPTGKAISVVFPADDADHLVWNETRYPWLRDRYETMAADFAGYSSYAFDGDTRTVTFHYDGAPPPAPARRLKAGDGIFLKHFVNMQAWGVYGFQLSGLFELDDVHLYTAAGMGLRCDFCRGTVLISSSSVAPRPGTGRTMSTTADGIHFMHHAGHIVLRNTHVAGTGDDCFNTHGNFFVLGARQQPSPSALSSLSSTDDDDERNETAVVSYIDETGPGWIPGSPTFMVGDEVAFYSRQTLQQLGPANRIVAATGGFGRNATITFAEPVPTAVKNYDMVISTTRVTTLDVEGCLFEPGGRGLVVSAVGTRIVNNTFRNLHAAAVLFLEGGCGAFEDYTEGPLSRDILIADNHFDHSYISHVAATQGKAVVQLGACVPLGVCRATSAGVGAVAAPAGGAKLGLLEQAPTPYPMPRCTPGGSTAPPIVQHYGDTGPGRITEPGKQLASGLVYENVTVSGNVFRGPSSLQHFIEIGNTAGPLTVTSNSMAVYNASGTVLKSSLLSADVHVYSSTGFDPRACVGSNACFGADGEKAECTVQTEDYM